MSSLVFTGSGYYRSGTNFATPASNIISGFFFIDTTPSSLGAGGFYFICGDQNATPANQHFMLRYQRVSPTVVCASLTCYGPDAKIHHFKDNLNVTDGLQGIGFVLDMADYTDAILFDSANGYRTVATDQSSWTDGPNVNTIPLILGARGDGTNGLVGTMHYGGIWNAAISEANFLNMASGLSPLRYSFSNMMHFFDCDSNAATFVEQVSDQTFTKTGTVNITSTPLAVENMALLTPTIVQDGWADFTAANQDKNSGAGLVVLVRANAGGTNHGRAFFDFGDLIALGIPAGSTINSATLTLECTTVTAASAQPLEVRAVTRAIVEGTGTSLDQTDGLCWDRYDATNTWTVEGGDFTGTADDNTTDANLVSPIVTGSYPYLVTNAVAACMGSLSGKCVLCLKRKTELTTASNVQYSSSEGATPPTLSINYTPPAGGAGRVTTFVDMRSDELKKKQKLGISVPIGAAR